MPEHDVAPLGEIHISYNWTYADAAERTGAVGLGASDVGKFARQLDYNTIWMLIDDSPVTWAQIGELDPTAAPLNPPFAVLTDAATVTWATAGARINNAKVTLGDNRILDITGAVDGASGVLIVIQDGTGSRTLTLPAGSKVIGGGGGAITLTTSAGGVDILTWVYDGTNFYWTYGLNFT